MEAISIAKRFSDVPAGRYPSDGEFSGELFRESILIPELAKGPISVILDAEGYGSSFLEESFGGLIRRGYDYDYLKKNISFISEDESLIEEINFYIDRAHGKALKK